ncbi:DsbA family protein [Methyloligella sp. 2.7D]|uniref:DsbA family protein n=1 Tax=unclassified Methyloligella TaxID=2625955 RepID=UPI00157D9B20|nr:DsbA family protein [Methyloligella sp. GL2]QKP77828.1 DsbA family protein [Methyloligella sp. GL2]
MRKSILIAIALIVTVGAIAVFGSLAMTARDQSALQTAIAANSQALYRDSATPVLGDPDGDVTLVIFSDYNCPDCRKADPAVEKLLADGGKLRVVMKELPIMGQDSEMVARLALAADAQGQYASLHRKLFQTKGRATPTRAQRYAKELGLDLPALVETANSQAVLDALDKNRRLAEALGVPGVPFFLVGDKRVTEGDDLYDKLKAAVADIRENGGTAAF